MKYPRTQKEALKALEEYRLSLTEDKPQLIVNLVDDTNCGNDFCLMDALLLSEGFKKPVICIKSMYFDLCETSQKELEIESTIVDVKDFLAAADAISQYIYSKRDIEEIV